MSLHRPPLSLVGHWQPVGRWSLLDLVDPRLVSGHGLNIVYKIELRLKVERAKNKREEERMDESKKCGNHGMMRHAAANSEIGSEAGPQSTSWEAVKPQRPASRIGHGRGAAF